MLRSAVKAFAFAMAVMFSLYSFPLFCLDAVAVAQQTNPHNGKWLAKYISTLGNQFEATVVVEDTGGTWTTHFKSRKNPCLGLTVPIEVARPATDTLEISVWGTKAVSGCMNFKLTVKRVDDNTLVGKFGDGREVTLVRQ